LPPRCRCRFAADRPAIFQNFYNRDIDLDVPEEQADAVKGGLADIADIVIKKSIDKTSP
jgi:hypothetical protein